MQTDYDTFDGKIYLVTLAADRGATPVLKNPHYYDGALTTDGLRERLLRPHLSVARSTRSSASCLNFSAVNDPMNWDTGTGHGYINLSLQDADSEVLTSLEVYYDKLAIFSTEAIQLWAVDPDPLQNAYVQLLRGTGTSAPRSTAQYGSGDVLYLDQSGVRSMKARDSSNSAGVSDIGSPIDSLIQSVRAGNGDTYFDKAIACWSRSSAGSGWSSPTISTCCPTSPARRSRPGRYTTCPSPSTTPSPAAAASACAPATTSTSTAACHNHDV